MSTDKRAPPSSELPPSKKQKTEPKMSEGFADSEYKGYAIHDTKKWSEFDLFEYKPKTWTEDDVELAITHCGVCGSDVHTITAGWGEIKLPLVVGHEIVGKAVRVGSNVKGIKVGDRVGVGAQIGSCYKCKACHTDNENYCPDMIDTYNAEYPDGVRTQGGYSKAIRAHQQFVFPIPDKVESKDAASMLCAGLTVFSPLIRNGCGPGKKVGVIGIGGLGHYAVLFAKALGAEVYAFSHSDSKKADVMKMGADHFVVTKEEGFYKPFKNTFDIVISTLDVTDSFPLGEYLSTLWIHGIFIMVGLPDSDLPTLNAFNLLPNGCRIGGSHIGSKKEALQMLDIAAEKGVKPWIQEMPMKEASKAVQMVKDGSARYRIVLTQDLQ